MDPGYALSQSPLVALVHMPQLQLGKDPEYEKVDPNKKRRIDPVYKEVRA